MRSECGARARSRKPLPRGSGPPLGRHDDRSPRSSVDSRQIEAGNARQIGPQETRESALRLPSGEAKFVARVEQREPRELTSSFTTVPGFRSTQSGLRINSDAERIARTNCLFLPARNAGEGTTRRVVEG